MGNELNKSQIKSVVEEEHIIFPGYSKKLSKQNLNKINSNEIIEDKEDKLISEIFQITLDKNNNSYTYLEEYVLYLQSNNIPLKFKIKNLEEMIEYITKDLENPLDYLFDCYHCSIEIIEIQSRNEYDDNFREIHRILAYYIGAILAQPELLERTINVAKRYDSFIKYLDKCNLDELGFLIYDIEGEIGDNEVSLKIFFGLFFKYLHEKNQDKFKNFLDNNYDEILVKNMKILKSIFITFPYTIKIYMEFASRENTLNTGAIFQKENYISKYIDVSPNEGEITPMKKAIDIFKPQKETDKIIKNYIDKLNQYLEEVTDFLITMYVCDSSHSVLNFAFDLIKLNINKIKLVKNIKNLSSNGFFLNTIIILNKIFFREYEKGPQNEVNYSNFIFKVVGNIDPLFTLSDNFIPFNKFERTNLEIIEGIINDQSYKDSVPLDFNIYTKLFFIQDTIIALSLKNFNSTCENLSKLIQSKFLMHKTAYNDSELNNFLYIQQFLNIYLKNNEMNKGLLRFSEVTTFLLFSLNNKKYSQQLFCDKPKEINYKQFLDDFYSYINYDDNFALSFLPQFVFQNPITICKYIKRFHEESILENMNCTKALIYFSLIFSCQNNLIRNPHFRMEIFDVMIFILSVYDDNAKTKQIFKILNEKFIKESLMVSILRVFVDAERLGTANQFYEKLVVRAKILILIENINKCYGHLFEENIKDYTIKYNEDSKKMMYNLLKDLIYLSDECIENLKLIKKYEDLVADTATYNRMSIENKRFEEDKFKQKDKLVRIQIKLFNGALKFLVSICLILQNFFIKNEFTTNLVGFLNYSLNIFASPKLGYEIRTKNVNEYSFKPHFILGSILTIYSAFYDKIEFIQCVIKDERSYKFDNFDRAKNLVANNSSIEISQKNFQNYIIFVDKLRKEEKRIKAEQINFDDAPEEFLDTLTALIMTDPVKLPKSHVILDRKTIETHLLSDQTDPFNREPLTKDMLIPCPELKAKIEEYINKKKSEKLNSKNTQTNKING